MAERTNAGAPNRLLKSDASSRECDGYAQEKDAGSANSSAIGATEDVLSRRPVRSGGWGFAFQQPPKPATILARPEPLSIDLARTAVIVVDMQNAFVSPGGMFDQAGYDISGAPACIANNARLLPALRAAGVKIVYLKMSYSADYSDSGGPGSPNYHKELGLALMQAQPEKWGKYVTEGTWDEEVVEQIAPQPGDIVVRKQRYSGYAGTNLDMILKTHGISYCLYTGVATNVCVETTLRDGFLLDYWPVLVADACNNSGPEHNRLATEWNVEHAFGWVTTTSDVLTALSGYNES